MGVNGLSVGRPHNARENFVAVAREVHEIILVIRVGLAPACSERSVCIYKPMLEAGRQHRLQHPLLLYPMPKTDAKRRREENKQRRGRMRRLKLRRDRLDASGNINGRLAEEQVVAAGHDEHALWPALPPRDQLQAPENVLR